MKQIILVVIMMVLSISYVNAQGGKQVKFEELGLSFKVPNGWTGGVKDDLYLLGHNSIPGLMILTQNRARNGQELKRVALQGISTEGINLTPSGDFKLSGNDKVEGFYEGIFNGSNVKVFAIGLINSLGSGMNIFIVTEKGKFNNSHIQEANKLARSVRFFQKKDSPETLFWKRRIVGKRLKYMKTSGSTDYDGGYNNVYASTTIKLFPNGTFTYNSSNSGSFSGTGGFGSARGKSNDSGKYTIYTVGGRTYLELMSEDSSREYELTVSPKKYTLLNGTRYLVLNIDE